MTGPRTNKIEKIFFDNLINHQKMAAASYQPITWSSVDTSAICGELPPGEYVIGDLYYLIDRDIYVDVWTNLFHLKNGTYRSSRNEIFAIKGASVGSIFKGTNNFRYTVDSGNIGIANYSLIDKDEQQLKPYGTYHKFDYPVKYVFNSNGLLFQSGNWKLFIETY